MLFCGTIPYAAIGPFSRGQVLIVIVDWEKRSVMPKIEVRSFFYDLIHCKDKILSTFDKFDEVYGDDDRGALVAGIREMEDGDLINLLINIQRLAMGFQEIQDLMNQAEEEELKASIAEDDEEEDDDEI